MNDQTKKLQGRGAVISPPNRFERYRYEADPEADPDEISVRTEVLVDPTRTIITRNSSPDVGFETSINPYRGCEHGCVYCFARPTHEFLGFSSGLDFETKIMAKLDAPALLRSELTAPSWNPQVIAISGVTDPYQPIEKKLRITRGCLEVLAEFRNPVTIISKNHLVTRDTDLLGELAAHEAAAVSLSVTTLDPELARRMEPRASTPQLRLEAIRQLAAAGVPVGVMVAPIIPGITDHEMPAILEACYEAGARRAGYVVLRLPHALKAMMEAWLEEHFPDRKEKVLSRLRSLHDGKLYDPEWGTRQRGEGAFADQIAQLFAITKKRLGYLSGHQPLSAAGFRRPFQQGTLF
jgi:DNA repair photolyase